MLGHAARLARARASPFGAIRPLGTLRHAASSSRSTAAERLATHTACGLKRVPFNREGFAAEGLYSPERERANCGVGIVCQMDGSANRAIVEDALLVLARMSHRGGTGCDVRSGDGAGIMLGMPDAFMREVALNEFGYQLPPRGRYAVGNMFFGHDALQNDATKGIFHKLASLHGFNVLGWRRVPTDNSMLGDTARMSEPLVEQVFLVPKPGGPLDSAAAAEGGGSAAASQLARELYRVRKVITNEVRASDAEFYVASLDANTIVYKGLLTARQIPSYYKDLQQPSMASHLGMVHSRFSTNTVPSWDRAQPNRRSCHNGEINTVRGNMNSMRARSGVMRSPYFADSTSQLLPIVSDGMSDSGNLDAVVEMLCHASEHRTLPEAVTLCVPESQTWHEGSPSGVHHMDAEDAGAAEQAQREMAEFNAMQMEPWDGPAMVGFTDGRVVGATLDRNGLRPMRYCVTADGRLVMGSEAGTVLGIDDADVIMKGKLQPGRMLLMDLDQGRMVPDRELKAAMAAAHPYGDWLREQSIALEDWVEAARMNTAGHRRGGGERPLRDGAAALPSKMADTYELHAKPGSEFWSGRYAGEEAGSKVDLAQAKARATRRRLVQNGFSAEDMTMLLGPMSAMGKDPLGSMGNDAPLAVLSRQPRSVFDYFKQLFAQVTNPPIDPIRERLVMSLRCPIGPEGNLLDAGPENCGRLVLPHPVLLPEELMVMRDTLFGPWKSEVLDITFDAANSSAADFKQTVQQLCLSASALARQGQPVLVLSDRAAGEDRLAVPSLLAVAAVHNHLVKTLQRTSVALVVDSGDAREVHHFCTLLGFGADAICPHQAYDALELMNQDGLVKAAKRLPSGEDVTFTNEELHRNYRDSIGSGIMKVMSKMGISTVQSYKGAQVFEAVGIADDIIDSCFPGTTSRISGTRFEALFADILRLHDKAWSDQTQAPLLPSGGQFHVRDGGETHFNGAAPMASLQHAVRAAAGSDDARAAYAAYAEATDKLSAGTTLRGVLRFVGASERAERGIEAALPVPIEEVESAAEIVKRFNTGAMSLGSISQETHETLAVAMNRLGGRSNTGEGGEDIARFDDERRSSIKQVASGRFGVTSNYLANADQLQIKVAQGAKPGEGGELPGNKVTDYIGATRKTVPGVGLISPPPHHDIYSIEDLAQLIHDLKCANPPADISVKLVSSAGVGVVAAGVAKAKADHITISGHDGGTGAAAWTGIKHCGVPWELGIADAQQTLVLNGLRGRVTLQADGQMKTGRDVVVAALLGAEEVGFSTAPLISLGCIMMRKCHLNTCPVGIATQDPELRAKFAGTPEHVMNFFWMMAEEVRHYMAELGVRSFDDLVGRTDWLEVDQSKLHYKSAGLDFSQLLLPAHSMAGGVSTYDGDGKAETAAAVRKLSLQDHGLDANTKLDHIMIEELDFPFLEEGRTAGGGGPLVPFPEPRAIHLSVENVHRTLGTMLSYEVSRRYGEDGMPDDTITVNLTGSAGQSLGFALAPGITIDLEGEANDYVGKGLSGGKIVVRAPERLVALGGAEEGSFATHEHTLIGNTCMYGAITGTAFFNGRAGERFCVRNSGAHTVVEGTGDHGCEYMTGGRVVVLGNTGRNFAAGMSGGVAFVYDPEGTFARSCNMETVGLEPGSAVRHAVGTGAAERWMEPEVARLRSLVQQHADATGSAIAIELLADWESALGAFTFVVPHEYRSVLNTDTYQQFGAEEGAAAAEEVAFLPDADFDDGDEEHSSASAQ